MQKQHGANFCRNHAVKMLKTSRMGRNEIKFKKVLLMTAKSFIFSIFMYLRRNNEKPIIMHRSENIVPFDPHF